MARPRKQTVDYFPHTITTNSRTLFILETKYGNDGYAFWFKLLEVLGSTNGHSFSTIEQTDLIFLSAKVRMEEEKVIEILDLLASLDAIDKELWTKHKVIWCQNFIDNLSDLYSKRKVSAPKKPVFEEKEEFTPQKLKRRAVSGVGNPQSKLNKTKLNKSKVKQNKENVIVVDKTQLIIDAYEKDIGLLSGTVKESINYYLEEGVEAELIIQAIKIAAKNNVKRFSYAEGTLNNWIKEGIKTLHEYDVKEKNKCATKQDEPTTGEMRAFLEGE